MSFWPFEHNAVALPSSESASTLHMDELLQRPAIRLLAFLTTVLTTRHLLEDGFHFPTYLLLAHIAIALFLKTTVRSRRSEERVQDSPQRTSFTSAIWLLLYTASVSGALICGYQSLQHVKNTILWMMVFTLPWDSLLPNDIRPLIERGWSCSLVEVLRFSTFTICVVLLFMQDGQMSGKGEYLALGAIGSMLLAGRVWRLGEMRELTMMAGRDAHALALAISVVPIVLILIPNEWSKSGNFSLYGHLGLLLLNLPAGGILLFCGFGRNPDVFEEGEEDSSDRSGLHWAFISAGLVVVTELDNVLMQLRPTATTFGQWATFAVASLGTLDIEKARSNMGGLTLPWFGRLKLQDAQHSLVPQDAGEAENEEDLAYGQEESSASHTNNRKHLWSSLAFQSVSNALVWLLVLHDVLMHRHFEAPFNANEGTLPRLDIVVSRYEEHVDTMTNAVNSVLQIPKVAGMNTTVVIYNKGSDIGVASRFPLASNVIVNQRENVGREGENILSHVLNSSDASAEHTLFMQAQPHELDWMVARIRQYFVEDTGFLSLSYTGAFCSDCERCWDVSGWQEDPSTIEDVFEQTNPELDCQGMSLTYRGQFIVSRERMEKIDRGALSNIRERLLKDEVFGFSLERLWGVVFGCPVIASTCPSLWSGAMGIYGPGGLQDCQCLDKPLNV